MWWWQLVLDYILFPFIVFVILNSDFSTRTLFLCLNAPFFPHSIFRLEEQQMSLARSCNYLSEFSSFRFRYATHVSLPPKFECSSYSVTAFLCWILHLPSNWGTIKICTSMQSKQHITLTSKEMLMAHFSDYSDYQLPQKEKKTNKKGPLRPIYIAPISPTPIHSRIYL